MGKIQLKTIVGTATIKQWGGILLDAVAMMDK